MNVILRLALTIAGVCTLLCDPATLMAQIPAFPGAEGAGAFATGGRPVAKINYYPTPGSPVLEKRGAVYHVTTLASDPDGTIPGSLRYGLKTENFWYRTHPGQQMDINIPDTFDVTPRIIVFDVGGTIDLSPLPTNQRDIDITPMNFTLAGQTAPGGITIHGGEFNPAHREAWDNGIYYPDKTNNLILRNVSILTDDSNEKDALWFATTNSIADHLSLSWYTDEGVSVTDSDRDVTVQYSIVGPGWHAPDGQGSQIEGKTPMADISFHHNLYIHNDARVPRVGEKVGPGVELDFRNNVIYDWNDNSAGYSAVSESGIQEPSFSNFVNNYYITGSGNDTNDVIFNTGNNATRIYQSGNLLDRNFDGVANGTDMGWAVFTGNELQQSVPYTVPHGVTQTPAESLATIQAYVGARWWERSFLDQRSLSQLAKFGQGTVAEIGQVLNTLDPADVSAVVNAPLQTRPAGWDTDNDGMPNSWELQHGLNPNSPAATPDWNQDFDADGYINVEEYINEIAEWPAPDDIVWTGGANRYAAINNWSITRSSPGEAATTTHWQPSRFDTALISSGTVAVDAVGQHANVIRISAGAGDSATLSITAGWLQVENQIVIGGTPTSQATLNLSGGELRAGTLNKGTAGTFNFSGGVLRVDTVNFSLVNNGGIIAPGNSSGLTHIVGDLIINSGTLEIEIGGTAPAQYDKLLVDGVAHLGGTLKVTLVDLGSGLFAPQLGDQFAFLASQGTSGMFALDLPQLASGLTWALTPGGVTTFLSVVSSSPTLAGDYNNDGFVDAADYTVWRDALGNNTALPNETATPGIVDIADYDAWKNNFGASGSGSGNSASVPEPPALVLISLVIAISSSWFERSRRIPKRNP